jgi:hypothetical protein
MRLPGRPKSALDAKMELHLAILEPAPAALLEMGRLCNLGDAKHIAIETARLLPASLGHRQLDVVD